MHFVEHNSCNKCIINPRRYVKKSLYNLNTEYIQGNLYDKENKDKKTTNCNLFPFKLQRVCIFENSFLYFNDIGSLSLFFHLLHIT